MSKNMFRAIALCCFLLLFQACGDDSKPTHNVALQQIQQNLEDTSFMKISKLTYDNGFDKGNGFYVVSVSYDITFTRSFSDVQSRAGFIDMVGERNYTPSMSAFHNFMNVAAIRLAYGNFDVGDTVHDKANFLFQKTEKGWRYSGRMDQNEK